VREEGDQRRESFENPTRGLGAKPYSRQRLWGSGGEVPAAEENLQFLGQNITVFVCFLNNFWLFHSEVSVEL